jgi:nucleoside-diphosphate-sugar epimerase
MTVHFGGVLEGSDGRAVERDHGGPMTSAVDGKTVLVAGASGYLGRHVVRTLAANGARVRALVRPGREAPGAHECFEGQATDSVELPPFGGRVWT